MGTHQPLHPPVTANNIWFLATYWWGNSDDLFSQNEKKNRAHRICYSKVTENSWDKNKITRQEKNLNCRPCHGVPGGNHLAFHLTRLIALPLPSWDSETETTLLLGRGLEGRLHAIRVTRIFISIFPLDMLINDFFCSAITHQDL